MPRYAIIHSGTVRNVIIASADFAAQIGAIAAPASVAPGHLYDGEAFSAPPPEPPAVPQAVTMRQARLALLAAGKLAAVSAAIAALPEPQRSAASIEWEYSGEVQRHNGFVAALGPALGLTIAQIDALFIAAAGL